MTETPMRATKFVYLEVGSRTLVAEVRAEPPPATPTGFQWHGKTRPTDISARTFMWPFGRLRHVPHRMFKAARE